MTSEQSQIFKLPQAAGIVRTGDDPGYFAPADAKSRAALEHWRDLKFGVIIHWGLYTKLSLDGSWTLDRTNDEEAMLLPADFTGDEAAWYNHYQHSRTTFDAPDFDARQWARAAGLAGARYLVFTAKHHDGFAMYDTKQSDFKITAPDSLWGRDALREMFDAFRNEGMETGVYFSKADWAHEGYWDPSKPIVDRFRNYDASADPERWKRFQSFVGQQIDELLSQYGAVNVLWLDAGWVAAPDEDLDIAAIAHRARELQPGILVVDREVHGPNEDYRTPEQSVPDEMPDYPWESCVTLSDHWCSLSADEQTKSAQEVTDMLVRVVARGGNLLLGIGPDPTGAMPPAVSRTLAEIGRWMDLNSHALTRSRPLAQERLREKAENGSVVIDGAEWWVTSHPDAIHLISLEPVLQQGRSLTVTPRERVICVDGARHWSQSPDGAMTIRLADDFGADGNAVVTMHLAR